VTRWAHLRQWRWRVAIAAVFLVVTTIGAAVQAGVLAPQFRSFSGGGRGNDVTFKNVENVSWRTWTITGLHLAGHHARRAAVDGHLIDASLHMAQPATAFRLAPALSRVVVEPGHQFTVALTNLRGACASTRRGSMVSLTPIPISVALTVSTPFGKREVVEVLYLC